MTAPKTAAQVARDIKRELTAELPNHTFSVRSFTRHDGLKAVYAFYWPDPQGLFRDKVQAVMEKHSRAADVLNGGAGYYSDKPRELGGTAEFEPNARDLKREREAMERMGRRHG